MLRLKEEDYAEIIRKIAETKKPITAKDVIKNGWVGDNLLINNSNRLTRALTEYIARHPESKVIRFTHNCINYFCYSDDVPVMYGKLSVRKKDNTPVFCNFYLQDNPIIQLGLLLPSGDIVELSTGNIYSGLKPVSKFKNSQIVLQK